MVLETWSFMSIMFLSTEDMGKTLLQQEANVQGREIVHLYPIYYESIIANARHSQRSVTQRRVQRREKLLQPASLQRYELWKCYLYPTHSQKLFPCYAHYASPWEVGFLGAS